MLSLYPQIVIYLFTLLMRFLIFYLPKIQTKNYLTQLRFHVLQSNSNDWFLILFFARADGNI
jgi:hypothetical protein